MAPTPLGFTGQDSAAGEDSSNVLPYVLPAELAQLASSEDGLDEEQMESTVPLDLGNTAKSRVECPYERSHRQGSAKRYRMPIGGIACCNFCRRRLSEWVYEFFRVRGFHPMYEPDTFFNCKRRWFESQRKSEREVA